MGGLGECGGGNGWVGRPLAWVGGGGWGDIIFDISRPISARRLYIIV